MGDFCRGEACGGGACEECVQKCILIHGTKDPSPIVTSFFKIIMSDLPKALFIPPKFAKTIASLVNQETYLEDANGQRWKVKLSMLDGSLVFQQGWREFASDHSLVTGDFVVFYYILGSHFVVQIYSRSGCEKFKSSEKKNSVLKRKLSAKRPLDHLPSGGRESSTSSLMFDSDSFNEQGSTSTVHSDFEAEIYENNSVVKDVEHVTVAAETISVCNNSKTTQPVQQPADCFEIPFYMFDRSSVDKQQEANRSSLFDLSNFEMLQSRPGADGRGTLSKVIKEEKFPCYDINSVQPQTQEACPDMRERKRKAEDGEEVSFGKEGISRSRNTSKQPSTCSKNERMNLNISAKASRKYPSNDTSDLSNFEMLQSRPSADGRGTLSKVIKEEKFPCYDINSVQPQTQEVCPDMRERKHKAKDGEEVSFGKEGISRSRNTSKQPSTCSKNERMNLNISAKASRKYPSNEEPNCMPQGTDTVIFQNGHTPAQKKSRSIPPVASMSRCPKSRSSSKEKDCYSGREPVAVEQKHEDKVKEKHAKPPLVVKMECEETDNHLIKHDGHALKVVKTESVDSVSLPLPIAVDFRISVPVETQSFLELPVGLPSFSCKGRATTDRKFVLLRDPSMRKWPIIYHERNGFKVLACGWEALAMENNIQEGDICNLVLENESESLLEIHIDRNPSL